MRDKLTDMTFTIPLVAVPSVLLSMWGGFEAVERIATKHFVMQQIRMATAPVEETLQEIRAAQLDQQLRELYRARCNGFATQQLNTMIRDLERQYHVLTGQPYNAMPCEFLVRAQA